MYKYYMYFFFCENTDEYFSQKSLVISSYVI